MASVRSLLLYSALCLAALAGNYGYGHSYNANPRRRIIKKVVVPQEHRVHVTHEVHHVVHKKRRRVRPVVHVVEEVQPEIVVVEDTNPGAGAYLVPQQPIAPVASIVPVTVPARPNLGVARRVDPRYEAMSR